MPEICKKLSGTVRKPEVCSAPSVPQAFHALEMLEQIQNNRLKNNRWFIDTAVKICYTTTITGM